MTTYHREGRDVVPIRSRKAAASMPSYAVFRGGANRARGAIAILALAVSLGGCVSDRDTTGAVALSAAPLPEDRAALRAFAADWGRRHEAEPDNVAASINYARALRALTQYAQATAVLETAVSKRPTDLALLGAYGKALADAGRPREAMDVLSRAHTPDRPDWSVLSSQGAVADQLGDHAGAVNYYEAALKLRPGEPTVLSNLGLSYALAKDLARAEEIMRLAAADPRADARVRQNYALVLSLEGKFKQAEGVAATDLSPSDAAASVDAIRQMIASDARWRGVGQGGAARVPIRPAAG